MKSVFYAIYVTVTATFVSPIFAMEDDNFAKETFDFDTIKIIEKIGHGGESVVFKIQDKSGNFYALKEHINSKTQKKEILAENFCKKSRAFINMPLIIDNKSGKTVYPLLARKINVKDINDMEKVWSFEAKMNQAFTEDGLRYDDHTGINEMFYKMSAENLEMFEEITSDENRCKNIMFDENDNVLICDLGGISEI